MADPPNYFILLLLPPAGLEHVGTIQFYTKMPHPILHVTRYTSLHPQKKNATTVVDLALKPSLFEVWIWRIAPTLNWDSACWFLSLRTWRKRFKVPKQLAQCNASRRPLRTPGSSACSIQPDMSCFFAPSWPCWRETISSQLSPVIGLPSPRYLRIHLAPKCNRTLQDGPPQL